ncbi:MAG: hypothetical protein A2W99_10285 [Bacteroidetes bacterium GWF2_33_16]|nr:MAG: hypothetical protein A2X00_05455 [Bacteroidetes bacterium GWE2_32_14]OFY03936.1 MAG: hypothetical protein A2W99_10285 [Bacteroidetes bacterium GWF2_33_16]
MTLTKNKIVQLIFITVLIGFLTSCKITYNLTGASIAPEVKTVSVQYFENRAPQGIPNLGQLITDDLKDRFKSQTSLNVVEDMGHLNFEGDITGYEPNRPVAIQGNEVAAKNRFTITVRVRFTNEKDPKLNFDTSFSRYKDWDSTQDLSSIEEQLVEEILELLIDDIFNKSVVNW